MSNKYTMKMPYFKQTENNCNQAALKMILKSFFPRDDYSYKELDKLTKRKKGQFTLETQLFHMLLERGLDIKYFSTADFDKSGDVEYIKRRYGNHILPLINLESVEWSKEYLSKVDYSKKKLTLDQVTDYFKQGFATLLRTDADKLHNLNKNIYQGHAIVLTGIDKDKISYHDSSDGPNIEIKKEKLAKAWNTQGTDNAVVFVRKK